MIEADRLTKRYGSLAAADEVSFAVKPGEVVGLLGPNGAGKTTVLRMLAGILTPSGGAARICGVDPVVDPFEAKRRLGFLSGGTALYKRFTPREVLRFFGRLHDLPEATIARRTGELVELLQMADFADRRCDGLSSGQLQKANLARAFLHDPPSLILDEPTASLDIVTGSFLLSTIRAARAAGKAVLFSTHIMSEAEYLCDRVVLIHKGRVVDQGPVADICARRGVGNLTDAFLSHVGETVRVAP